MQFVLMIYQGTTPLPTQPERWATLSDEEQKAVYADYGRLNTMESVTSGPPLGLPEDAVTVRVADGLVATAAGPYAGAEHAVGGFAVVEADDLAGAVEVARSIPAARLGGAVEIRPVATYW
jgi:hypothetical protein